MGNARYDRREFCDSTLEDLQYTRQEANEFVRRGDGTMDFVDGWDGALIEAQTRLREIIQDDDE